MGRDIQVKQQPRISHAGIFEVEFAPRLVGAGCRAKPTGRQANCEAARELVGNHGNVTHVV